MPHLHDPSAWVRPPRRIRPPAVSRANSGRVVLLDETILLRHIARGATVEQAAALVPMSAGAAGKALAIMRLRFDAGDNQQLLQQPEVIEALQDKGNP